jgi:hypothetical protein
VDRLLDIVQLICNEGDPSYGHRMICSLQHDIQDSLINYSAAATWHAAVQCKP